MSPGAWDPTAYANERQQQMYESVPARPDRKIDKAGAQDRRVACLHR
jgi:hypothetical protein